MFSFINATDAVVDYVMFKLIIYNVNVDEL